jgi:uncharacterized delta-60 repeat protein
MALAGAAALCHGQLQPSWVHRYVGPSGSQLLTAGPVLTANDVYLAGQVENAAGDSEFALVRYGQATTVFSATTHNPGTNETDIPGALEVLPDGNLMMAGSSGNFLNTAIATAKFTPDGTRIWSRRFAAANFDSEQPPVLAFDAAGNVYVSGTTIAQRSDVMTVKYSADGEQQWASTFAGFSGSADQAAAIKLDVHGNVYVNGRSQSGSNWDLFTLKYDANGNELWARRYDGPLRQQENAGALVLDASGNAYIYGASIGQTGSGVTRYELVVVKYDTFGNELWASRFGLPGDISEVRRGMVLDDAGNLVVLANINGGEQQCMVMKLDPNGNRLWTARYNGVEDGYDNGYALTTDAAGNTYVAAASDDPSTWQFATLKFDPFGTRLWVAKFDADGIFDYPVGVAVDSGDGVYVAGQSRFFTGPGGFLAIKYSQPSTAPLGAPSIVASPGSQMVAGGSNATFRVTASGDAPLSYQWRYNGRRIPDATNSSLSLIAVTLEQSGQYSVEITNATGSVASPEADLLVLIPPSVTAQPQDQFAYAGTEVTFSVSAYGTEPFEYQWLRDSVALSNGTSRLLTLANVRAEDAGAYRAVVSNISGSATSSVARLAVSHLVQQDWVARYDGPRHDADVNPIVKVDGTGHIYVGGTSQGPTNADVAIIKYDSLGAALWTARYSAGPDTVEALFAMEVDANGVVWATGRTGTDDIGGDAFTVSFSADGTLRWARRLGATNSFAAGFGIAIDAQGNSYIAGQKEEDFLTIKYDFEGNELWGVAFNGAGNGTDTARSIAVFGTNIYVTGSSWNGSNLDFLTLNYSQGGSMLWRATYDAAETDNAVAVAVDPSGNIVVAGNSYGTINYDEYGSDFLVVKYSPGGARFWTARYDGFMNAEDYPSALTVDSAGNIYVTGHSDFESPDSGVRQFATLKYDPTGRELWRNWHISHQYDGSRSLAVDASGSVYITSLATGPFSGRDIGFIKYDPLGNRVVSSRYSGPGNADDVPSTLALGPGGDVYIAGTTSGEAGLDFVLVKYGQNAVAGLPTITEAPRGLDIGRGGNALFGVTASGDAPLSYQWLFNGVAIAGATNRTFDVTSAQFSHAGSYAVRVANALGSVFSAAAALLVQAPPSIIVPPPSQTIVAGSTASLRVSAEGSSPLSYQWSFNGNALPRGTNQQLTLPNVQPSDIGNYSVEVSNRVGTAHSAVARLNVTFMAQQLWATNYAVTDLGGGPMAMAVATDGSVYVAAGVGFAEGSDYGVTKFDRDGHRLWAESYGGVPGGYDVATDLAIDHEGNAYVTGWSWGDSSSFDAATIKYDPDGNQLWAARFNGPDNLEDIGHAIAVDTNGNVIVALSSTSVPHNVNFVTVCYSPMGTQKWAAVYNGPANSYDQPVDLAVDSAGVYVTGISTLNGLNTDFATLKYDTNGVEVWAARYNGPANIEDAPVRLGLDGAGSVYVAGWSHASNGVPDYALVKYTPSGQRSWAVRFDGLAGRYDYLSDMIVDFAGNVYVTGSSDTFAGDADWVTLKFNSNGARVWLATYGGSFGVGDNPAFLAFDASGNVCLAGSLYTGESYGVATACYDINGNRRWTAMYGADTHANEFATAIATDVFGGVVVGGSSVIANLSQSFLVNYAQSNVVGAPVITMPPVSSMVAANDSASFSVRAQGEGPLNYQWLRGRTPVPGGSQTNLVIDSAADPLAGYYSVEVQNHLGLVVSPAAELRVRGPVVPELSGALSDGMLRIVLLGEAGFNYRVEASSDLITWELVTMNYNQNSSIVITEPLSAARRYYRAVKLP